MSQDRHGERQQRLKQKVDERIEAAQLERGIVIVYTGNGKGKTTAAFGTVCRAIGHGKKAAVVQFIKGNWDNGERNILEPLGVPFHVMATGFTWETQNKQTDTQACLETWHNASLLLQDPQYDLVVLDELTYMVSYHYLPISDVINALTLRPENQSVIITGRACHRELLDFADTVTEMRPVKHAFDAGIKAQKGIDW
ncbi:Cob(I)yrinic acid a,c-diamide adenosyltransferase [Providencia rustigianii]|uniref:cob(I)yrinic acid a,c-diamide adenosyltransferase n=1 Tax=Providencia TaxID=586 RepID=UPI000D87505B|nr:MULTISPECIES: cob(I)yrinic acid a,c-diamide adenosyltransferase [Providencia]MTC57562.1 cob(I)yrinic acid a,c-diamide adenosyltransferase [Providencia rustigianii]SPY77656.1 Cob(I)yrinic acid a,c-diamide adenosyltransferase [Providencia rustigianii]VEB70046.1 Cob(I)yrinic acid a,c-diamide adenosyltransferase [Providencia rustigianii]